MAKKSKVLSAEPTPAEVPALPTTPKVGFESGRPGKPITLGVEEIPTTARMNAELAAMQAAAKPPGEAMAEISKPEAEAKVPPKPKTPAGVKTALPVESIPHLRFKDAVGNVYALDETKPGAFILRRWWTKPVD